jgi:hypothetical protein
MHRVALDEIDASRGHLAPFELHVSETGVDIKAAGQIASAVSHSKAPGTAANIAALFQYGPKTGDPVLDPTYADVVAQEILDRCPTGRITGLECVRESTKYAAISGEYVTVRGFCITD